MNEGLEEIQYPPEDMIHELVLDQEVVSAMVAPPPSFQDFLESSDMEVPDFLDFIHLRLTYADGSESRSFLDPKITYAVAGKMIDWLEGMKESGRFDPKQDT